MGSVGRPESGRRQVRVVVQRVVYDQWVLRVFLGRTHEEAEMLGIGEELGTLIRAECQVNVLRIEPPGKRGFQNLTSLVNQSQLLLDIKLLVQQEKLPSLSHHHQILFIGTQLHSL